MIVRKLCSKIILPSIFAILATAFSSYVLLLHPNIGHSQVEFSGQSIQNAGPGSKMLLSFGEIEQPTLLSQSENVYAFWNKDTEEDTFSFFRTQEIRLVKVSSYWLLLIYQA